MRHLIFLPSFQTSSLAYQIFAEVYAVVVGKSFVIVIVQDFYPSEQC